MNNIRFVADSSLEVDEAFRKDVGVVYAKCSYFLRGKEYLADVDWKNLSEKEFYDAMRAKERITTAQVTIMEFTNVFESILKEGHDILYFACSSAISGNINVGRMVRLELLEKYPERKIYIIDTLISGAGLGLILLDAKKKIFEENMDVDEYVSWLENNKLKFQMVGSVDDCQYLARSGRISGPIAFLTGLFSIKPIVISNCLGQNYSISKVQGRKKSLKVCVDYVKENITGPEDFPVIVCTADCDSDGDFLEKLIKEEVGRKVIRQRIGPCVASACGPGQVSLYFFGKEVDPKWK